MSPSLSFVTDRSGEGRIKGYGSAGEISTMNATGGNRMYPRGYPFWLWVALPFSLAFSLCDWGSVHAEQPSVPTHDEVARLARELHATRSGRLHWGRKDRPANVTMHGISQQQLLDALGAPDICFTRAAEGKWTAGATNGKHCLGAQHWAYFFREGPPSAVAPGKNGTVEVTVVIGGWGLEIYFAENHEVDTNKWTWEE